MNWNKGTEWRASWISILGMVAAMGMAVAAEPKTPLPTVETVLDRYTEAAGGRAALEKLKTRLTKGKMMVTTMGLSGGLVIKSKAPNRQVSRVELGEWGTMREGYDGKVAWSAAPGMGIRAKTGGELQRVQRTMGFPRELTLRAAYEKLEVKGSESIDGKAAWVVEAAGKSGKPDRLFFDQATGLLVREVSTVESMLGEMTFQVDFGDYRVVDGVKVPFVVRIPKPETMGLELRVEEVKHNVEVPDAEFSKPSE